MFAVFNSSKEKPIVKVLQGKRNPTDENNFCLLYRLVYISDSMDEFRKFSIRKIVVSR